MVMEKNNLQKKKSKTLIPRGFPHDALSTDKADELTQIGQNEIDVLKSDVVTTNVEKRL